MYKSVHTLCFPHEVATACGVLSQTSLARVRWAVEAFRQRAVNPTGPLSIRINCPKSKIVENGWVSSRNQYVLSNHPFNKFVKDSTQIQNSVTILHGRRLPRVLSEKKDITAFLMHTPSHSTYTAIWLFPKHLEQ